MASKRLTDRTVKALKPVAGRQVDHPDQATPGLSLRVSPAGSKSWFLRYRNAQGRQRRLKLGAYPEIGLAAARKKAQKAKAAILDGADPAHQERAETETTVRAVVEDFKRRHVNKRAASTEREYRRILDKTILPAWGARQIEDIEPKDVARIVSRFQPDRPYMARQTWRLTSKLLRWAKGNGYLDALPFDEETAKQLLDRDDYQGRDRVLSETELRAFWVACDAVGYPYGHFAKTILLTAQRPGTDMKDGDHGEVGRMRWADLDIDAPAPLWRLGRADTKSGRDHVVPLSKAAVAVLRSCRDARTPTDDQQTPPPPSKFVFAARNGAGISGFSAGKSAIERHMLAALNGLSIEDLDVNAREALPTVPRWTFHDLRRTASTRMRRTLGLSPELVDQILNHAVPELEETYQRGEAPGEDIAAHDVARMRAALEAWAGYLAGIVDGTAGGKVVSLQPAS